MTYTYNVFRGSPTGKITPDTITITNEHYRTHPQVLGHEGIGIIRALGPGVQTVKIGDRVGFGFIHSICTRCENCSKDQDQFCPHKKQYGLNDTNNGSSSTHTIWDSNCVFPIPENISSIHAAPLMCAGATVWTVLTRFNMQPGDRVGIMGVGGLGHLAIKLASAMGYRVVVLSGSEAKRHEAMEYGAGEFHVFRSGEREGMGLERPVRHLLLCGSGDVDYSELLPLMDSPSAIYPLTATVEPSRIPTLELCFKGCRIQGSLVASRQSTRALLEFAADKRIVPTVMTFPLTEEGIEEAMGKLREGKVRYRGVLVREM
ncbi:GroES-like protein [Aspergillus sclerotioniger CBS 115572]|uniref:GroES-like protein n=1 Tax=Aspergillus sclerotioniger CBS 115572 TaxID=1450535 RepID=A0A317X816_9EURO|nr:GroES-like protein [Aspergillus sclerotioniger CBS 115572]PWY93687.1 GroES-like protein [Aspergillus sclerotioniger CBS 115572]